MGGLFCASGEGGKWLCRWGGVQSANGDGESGSAVGEVCNI